MILRADNLIKTYKKRTVVKGISVEVNQGEIVGLLGPNGAGKRGCFFWVKNIPTGSSAQFLQPVFNPR